MQYNYILGPARIPDTNIQSNINDGTISRPRHRIMVHNQGNKRTAILGINWYTQGWEDETPVNAELALIWDYQDNSRKNRKADFAFLHQERINWMAGVGASYFPHVPENKCGMLKFPDPILIKDGYLDTIATITSGSGLNIDTVQQWWIADAIIKTGMGDFTEASRLNPGRARPARIGNQRIEAYSPGGLLQGGSE